MSNGGLWLPEATKASLASAKPKKENDIVVQGEVEEITELEAAAVDQVVQSFEALSPTARKHAILRKVIYGEIQPFIQETIQGIMPSATQARDQIVLNKISNGLQESLIQQQHLTNKAPTALEIESLKQFVQMVANIMNGTPPTSIKLQMIDVNEEPSSSPQE